MRELEVSGGLSLDSAPATRGQQRLYLGLAVALAVVSAALLPFSGIALPAVPEFNLLYASVVMVAELATAFLLLGQFRAGRRPALLVLASAYLFTSCTVLMHIAFFTEFATGLSSALQAPQAGAWLWHAWHIGFPALLLAYALVEWRAPGLELAGRAGRRLTAAVLVGVPLTVLAMTGAIVGLHDALPQLHGGRSWNPITYLLGGTAGALAVAALIVLVVAKGARHVLHLWLIVALTAFCFDLLPNLLAEARFALGWYLGRVEALLASSFLLVMLLTETNHLYRHVARSMRQTQDLNRMLESRVQARTQELETANAELTRMVEERETLIGEVYHRVNNNLQTVIALMNLERRGLGDAQAASAFDRVAGRVHSMALVHRQLMEAPSLESLDLEPFLRHLTERLRHALDLDRRGIVLVLQAESAPASLETGMRVGLLVNELVANAAEHAYPEGRAGEVRVELARRDGGLELRVTDDGVGSPASDGSMGLRIVQALVSQADGTLEQSHDGGMQARIVLPQQTREAA